MTERRKETGRWGEAHAVRRLREQGWQIIETNWRTRIGELDIIARDCDGTLVVVEVRTTRSRRFGYGFQSVDVRKQRQVRRLALQYIGMRGWGEEPVRIDVISVLLSPQNEPLQVDHVRGAF
jgi:putative endonuclease